MRKNQGERRWLPAQSVAPASFDEFGSQRSFGEVRRATALTSSATPATATNDNSGAANDNTTPETGRQID